MNRRRVGDVHKFATAYVDGVGLAAAAESAGMSRATAWRRLRDDDVRELVDELRTERHAAVAEWSASIRSLADMLTDAVVTVLDEQPSHGTVARLFAATIPEVRHLAETVELAERIERLEQMLADESGHDDLARVVAISGGE